MGRYRFVDPELVKLEISDGDWIKVDKETNFADAMRIREARKSGDTLEVLALIIREWSFLDRDGKPMPIDKDTISNLDVDTASEIATAALDHEKEQEKKPLTQTKTAKSVAQ